MADVGRPSDYDPKYCDELIKYFSVDPYRQVGNDTVASDFPSYAGFAAKIGKDRGTLREWCTEHPEFSIAYKRAKELQENWVIVNGNKGLINTAFGIFTTKNVLGWRDKQPEEVEKTIVNNITNIESVDLEARVKQIKGEE